MHAFQGRTVDNVIAAMEASHPNLTTQKSFYVEISRAHDRAELATDDTKALREQLEGMSRSLLNFARWRAPEFGILRGLAG